MEQKRLYGTRRQAGNMVDDYFFLIQNMPDQDKIELIAKISNSIINNIKQERKQTREEILAETYGSLESDKSADEIIEEIYKSRHFVDKNHHL